MEDDLKNMIGRQPQKNGRQFQFSILNGRQPQFSFLNGTQPYFFDTGRQPKSFQDVRQPHFYSKLNIILTNSASQAT
jgi:hypothetical protein